MLRAKIRFFTWCDSVQYSTIILCGLKELKMDPINERLKTYECCPLKGSFHDNNEAFLHYSEESQCRNQYSF